MSGFVFLVPIDEKLSHGSPDAESLEIPVGKITHRGRVFSLRAMAMVGSLRRQEFISNVTTPFRYVT